MPRSSVSTFTQASSRTEPYGPCGDDTLYSSSEDFFRRRRATTTAATPAPMSASVDGSGTAEDPPPPPEPPPYPPPPDPPAGGFGGGVYQPPPHPPQPPQPPQRRASAESQHVTHSMSVSIRIRNHEYFICRSSMQGVLSQGRMTFAVFELQRTPLTCGRDIRFSNPESRLPRSPDRLQQQVGCLSRPKDRRPTVRVAETICFAGSYRHTYTPIGPMESQFLTFPDNRCGSSVTAQTLLVRCLTNTPHVVFCQHAARTCAVVIVPRIRCSRRVRLLSARHCCYRLEADVTSRPATSDQRSFKPARSAREWGAGVREPVFADNGL